MAGSSNERLLALWSILGFASNQGFLYSLMYLGDGRPFVLGPLSFARGELVTTLLFMIASFVVMANVSSRARTALTARPLLWGYAALMLIASFIPMLPGSSSWAAMLAEGALVGLPAGVLFVAWGRVLGSQRIEHSVPEVVLSCALAAAVCFACATISPYLYVLPKALPLFGVLMLRFLTNAEATLSFAEGGEGGAQRNSEASRLSSKILVGAFLYGLVVGFTESFVAGDLSLASGNLSLVSGVSITLLFFIMFCLAMYQTISDTDAKKTASPSPWSRVRLFGQGGKSLEKGGNGPLDGAYRLSIALIMAGFLFAPVLVDFNVSGESVLVAGYLGLSVVLVALFLVMGRISGGDPAVSFSRGFAALFGGELIGIFVGMFADTSAFGVSGGLAFSGMVALVVYLFVFTERDFHALSVVVADTDSFARVCEWMANEYGLSPRETEILPLALRGRTGERMAAELFISKSTVETHVRRIYAKCGVGNRQELIDLGERLQRDGGLRHDGSPQRDGGLQRDGSPQHDKSTSVQLGGDAS